MDAFNNTSYYTKEPEVGFGTGTRPPLYMPGGGPGPGAYLIKTTMVFNFIIYTNNFDILLFIYNLG